MWFRDQFECWVEHLRCGEVGVRSGGTPKYIKLLKVIRRWLPRAEITKSMF